MWFENRLSFQLKYFTTNNSSSKSAINNHINLKHASCYRES